MEGQRAPTFFDIFKGEAVDITDTPYGQVGTLYSDNAIETVWVSKHGEAIDPGWFSSNFVDVIIVVEGQLKVEFEDDRAPERVMKCGEVLVLPARTRRRAYRWPRNASTPTVFIAAYPVAKPA